MNITPENLLLPNDLSWSAARAAIPHLNPTSTKEEKLTPDAAMIPKSDQYEKKLGPHVIIEDVHTEECQKSQGGYGYDVGIHWRVLAAVLYGIYTWFPLNTTSRIVGKLSQVPLPRFLRSPVMRAYAWIFSARLEEAEFHNDLARYSSISHFFRRRLIPSARPVDPKACLVSNCCLISF